MPRRYVRASGTVRQRNSTHAATVSRNVPTILSASPGALGGLRALRHLREILGNIDVLVLPEQWAVGKAHEAFDEADRLKDPKMQKAVEGLGQKLASVLRKLKS